jgi:hypothetical protein
MLYKMIEPGELDFKMPFSEFRVFGLYEAENLLENEPDKWNVISLWSEYFDSQQRGSLWTAGKIVRKQPELRGAKSIESHYFHDANYQSNDEVVLCEAKNINSILAFARSHQDEPLLVHCFAGISRSPAVAFLVMLDNIKDRSENPVEDALAIVHDERPQMFPNQHIIEIGIPLIAPDQDTEIRWFRELYNAPRQRAIVGG